MSTFPPLNQKPLPTNRTAPARKAAPAPKRTRTNAIRSIDDPPASATRPNSQQARAATSRVVSRMRASADAGAIQMKLEVSRPGDALEREADRVAEHVMRMPLDGAAQDNPNKASASSHSNSGIVQRACSNCYSTQNDEEKLVQRSTNGASGQSQSGVSAFWSGQLRSAQMAGGEALPNQVRSFMEPRFETSFANVRVHHDARASALAESVHARAFTVGHDIFFKRGELQPQTSHGQLLVAHELAHVLQQSGNRAVKQPSVALLSEELSLVQRQPQAGYFTSESSASENQTSGGPRVSYLADDIVAGRITDSGTLVRRLSDFSRDELNELLAQINYKASQRAASDPVVDGLIEAAKEEVQGALAGRVILKPLPPCTQSFAPPSAAAFAADIELERVRTGDLVLRPGVSSEGTQLVQIALHSFGCAVINKDLLPRFGADGSYGNETTRAVREFQSARGLAVDGTVGQKTLAVLGAFVGVGSGEQTGFPCVTPSANYPKGISERAKERIKHGAGKTSGEGCSPVPYWAGETSKICTIGFGHVIRGGKCTVDLTKSVSIGPDCDKLGSTFARPACDCSPPLSYTTAHAEDQLNKDIAGAIVWIKNNIHVDFVPEDASERAARLTAFDALVDLTLHAGSVSPKLVRLIHEKFCSDLSAVRQEYIKTSGYPARREEAWPEK